MQARRVAASLASAASLLLAEAAHGQGLPRVCNNSAPTQLVAPTSASPVSAVLAGEELWVLYSERDPRNQERVRLLRLTGVNSGGASVTTFEVDGGGAFAHALLVSGRSLFAAYRRTDGTLGVYRRTLDGGAEARGSVPGSSPRAVALSRGAAEGTAAVGWVGDLVGFRFATVDASAQVATPLTIESDVASPAAQSSGAAVSFFGARGDGAQRRVGLVPARARARFAAAGPFSRVPSATDWDLFQLGGRSIAAVGAADGMHVAAWAGAAPRGASRLVSNAPAARLAVGAAPWGSLVVWSGAGGVFAAPMDAAGSHNVSPLRLLEADPQPTAMAVVSTPRAALVFYEATRPSPSLRMLRLDCQ